MHNFSKLKKTVIIQSYNTPYRNNLFNEINKFSDIELFLVYNGVMPQSRKWNTKFESNFHERYIKIKNYNNISYEASIAQINYLNFIKIIFDIKPDIIITHFGQIPIWILIPLQIIFKFKLISWTETTLIASQGYNPIKWFHKPLNNIFNNYIIPGVLAKDYLKYCQFRITSQNVFYAPNSVDEIFNTDVEQINKKFYDLNLIKLLFVGSYIELKGVKILLECIQMMSSHETKYEFEFHFVGSGPIPIPQQNNIINHGYLEKDQIINLYKECHILVLPSLWDCNPLVVIEACKCGLIIMVSDGVGNFPEMVNENGIVFERGSANSLFLALNSILNCDSEHLKKMSIRSLIISKNISHNNSAKAFWEAIHTHTHNNIRIKLFAKLIIHYILWSADKIKNLFNNIR